MASVEGPTGDVMGDNVPATPSGTTGSSVGDAAGVGVATEGDAATDGVIAPSERSDEMMGGRVRVSSGGGRRGDAGAPTAAGCAGGCVVVTGRKVGSGALVLRMYRDQ